MDHPVTATEPPAQPEPELSTSPKLTTCFICGQDAESLRPRRGEDTKSDVDTDSWTIIQPRVLSACLFKLFYLAQEEGPASIQETYCRNCQELFATICVIYQQLEKLNRELEDKREIVSQQLSSAYASSVEATETITSFRDDSLQSRMQLRKKLLNGVKSKPSSSNESTKANLDRNRLCTCDCRLNTHATYTGEKDVTIIPELIEIKMEPQPQEQCFEGVEDEDEIETDSQDLDGGGGDAGATKTNLGPKQETEASSEELLSLTRSRTRLKEKRYSHFFQDSESDQGEDDGGPVSDGNEYFDPNFEEKEFDGANAPEKKSQRPLKTRPAKAKLGKKNSVSESGVKSTRRRQNKSRVCRTCGKTCKSGYDLKYHEENHKPDHERRHVCDVCGKGFFKNSQLVNHKRKHRASGDDGNCEGSSALAAGLSLCPICGRHMTQLITHMRSHTGEKLFSCSICGRSFGTRESVRVHSRIHTGEKPFECSTCGMRFRTSQAHRRHRTVHLGEKSFVCDHCGRAFRLRQSLREHLHVHTKEAPHRCNICGRRFASTGLLNEHLATDHTAEQIERKRQNLRRRKIEATFSSEIATTSTNP